MVVAEQHVRLPRQMRAQLVDHARSTAPQECCAVAIGPAGTLRELHLCTNVHPTPVTRYDIDPAQLLAIWRRADELGWQVTAVIHSHPATEAYPSETDVALAAWPDAVYVIVSLAQPDAPVIRAFRMRQGDPESVTEVAVTE